MKKILNVLLGKYYLTQKPNISRAYPVTKGQITTDDVIRMMKQDGMEIHEPTAKDIISRFHKKVAELVLSGFVVNTGLAILRPIIKGIFVDKVWDSTKHNIRVSFVAGPVLKSAIADTEVNIIGEKSASVQLFSVMDKQTENTDGKLKAGGAVELKGQGIKIAGDEEHVGIYFTNTATGESIKIPNERIVLNYPRLLLFMLPNDFEPGEYEISVVTQYIRSDKQYKNPQSAILPRPVIVS